MTEKANVTFCVFIKVSAFSYLFQSGGAAFYEIASAISLVHVPRKGELLCGVPNGNDVAVGILGNIRYGAAMNHAVLLRFPESAYDDHVDCIVFCVMDDFHVGRAALHNELIIAEIAEFFLVGLREGLPGSPLDFLIKRCFPDGLSIRHALLIHRGATGTGSVRNMQDMKHRPILFRQVKCVQEGDVGVLRKIRTVKDVLIGDDDSFPSILMHSQKVHADQRKVHGSRISFFVMLAVRLAPSALHRPCASIHDSGLPLFQHSDWGAKRSQSPSSVRGFYVFSPGSLTLKVEPFPFLEATEITPLCSSTIFFAIIRPRPVPLDPFVLKKV